MANSKKDSNKNSWYVVKYKSNKYSAIIFDNSKTCRKFAKSKGITYKVFDTKEDAILFAGCKKSKILFQTSPIKPPRICLCCEKPFHGKTKLCPTCNKLRGNISVRTIVTIKELYPNQSVFKTLNEIPNILREISITTTPKERARIRVEKTIEYHSTSYLKYQYNKTDNTIPDYIQLFFSKDSTKELLYIEGDRINPKIYYFCKRCRQEQCQTYDDLKSGKSHNCDSSKSSGEVIIEEYLKTQGIKFKSQRETLKCINPKTKKPMPYDFEILEKKIIIEVQGEQHHTYTPYFHGSIENFEYQLWKDTYKKSFAQNNGFIFIEIWYSDILSGRYKLIISDALKQV